MGADIHTCDPKIDKPAGEPRRRLILCFDGTGNVFKGNTSDTNIAKLYQKFDRCNPRQMHYYQPGIGTYTTNGGSLNLSWLGSIRNWFSETLDEAFATSFDCHVISGYKFLMQYYCPGDRIYIFGFSRGAFTAKYLSRMIAKVGLLSRGNEEMVPFAYNTYQDWEIYMSNPHATREEADRKNALMTNFKETFCWHDHVNMKRCPAGKSMTNQAVFSDSGSGSGANPDQSYVHVRREEVDEQAAVKVHFLGLFDTVSSVSTFDTLWSDMGQPHKAETAEHIRHAVAIDERRVKFKAALFGMETTPEHQDDKDYHDDIKEVWFPGNHGDLGGGWPAEDAEESRTWGDEFRDMFTGQFWSTMGNLFHEKKDSKPSVTESEDRLQLSDISLKWMIDELDALDDRDIDKPAWNHHKDIFIKNFNENRSQAVKARKHDPVLFGGGCSFSSVLFWKLCEYLPFFVGRWQLDPESNTWNYLRWPPNMGGTRDIPLGSAIHTSAIERMNVFERNPKVFYDPQNQISHPPIVINENGQRECCPLFKVQRPPIEPGPDAGSRYGTFSQSTTSSSRTVMASVHMEEEIGDEYDSARIVLGQAVEEEAPWFALADGKDYTADSTYVLKCE